ncbi:hypothetical protein EMCRGX_G034666 [Ephydatia muelleri]
MLDEMLEKDVIQPSHSPWSSPIILVRKKDGSMRFCVDYRKVNSVTKKDAYPLPRVDDTLDTLGGTKFFSTLDLASGYWQVEVEEADRQKTAFTTPEGLFEFKVMPFGLCNAPATFQRLMDRVLNDLKWTDCLVYFDDIVVVGRTFSEHLHCLGNVLTRLRQAGLKLQPKKCNFCQQKMRKLQLADPSVGPVLQAVELDRKPHPDESSPGVLRGVAFSSCGKCCVSEMEDKCTKNRAALQTVQAGSPMQIVAVDMGPLPETKDGIEAVTVAEKLVNEMFLSLNITRTRADSLSQNLLEKLPVDLMYGTGPSDSFTAGEYATELRNALHNAYAVVREKCNAEHQRQKSS